MQWISHLNFCLLFAWASLWDLSNYLMFAQCTLKGARTSEQTYQKLSHMHWTQKHITDQPTTPRGKDTRNKQNNKLSLYQARRLPNWRETKIKAWPQTRKM